MSNKIIIIIILLLLLLNAHFYNTVNYNCLYFFYIVI